MKNLIFLVTIFFPLFAFAEKPTPSETSDETKSPQAKQFEIIDGTAPITGEPGTTTEVARTKWSKACGEWKTETKDLNKGNQVMSLVCGSADCSYQENGSYVCTSTAVYKLKTEGVKAPPAPLPAPVKTEVTTTASPPQQIVEVTPAPQPGFLWVPGFWGWQSHRHVWYPGRWQSERPGYIWINHSWRHHGNRWQLETGRWNHVH